jgi:hypothetical protein
MATQASCDHPPLHDNIIFKQCINEDSRKGVYNRNILFVVIENTLLIVDCANFIEYCPHCKKYREIYIHGTWPNVRASFDGVTDLPICVTVNDIEEFPYIKIGNAPRFGNNFIYGANLHYHIPMYVIMYDIEVPVKGNALILHRQIFVHGKPAICCITTCGKFILIDCCGNIINAEVSYSETCRQFKIGNGYLTNDKMVWTYTSGPALNTKPAAASVDCSVDE